MKKSIIFIYIFAFNLLLYAQSADEYLKLGIEKHLKNDYQGAIIDYSKSIDLNPKNHIAYYNRATVEMLLKDYENAMKDFSKCIEIAPNYKDAYYSRATILAGQKKYQDALLELNKLIELDKVYPNALTLRGQIKVALSDKLGGCADFGLAKLNGDTTSESYIKKYCGNVPRAGETLGLDWPQNEKWKLAGQQENDEMSIIDLVREGETLKNWTEIGTMSSYKNLVGVSLDEFMKLMFEQSQKNSPKSKLTFIEKNETAEYPWIIFKIENPEFLDDARPESQVWYVIQGKTSLYSVFRAIKEKEIPKSIQDKWVDFFKTGKILYINK